jgi:hypothetical protein
LDGFAGAFDARSALDLAAGAGIETFDFALAAPALGSAARVTGVVFALPFASTDFESRFAFAISHS